MISLFYRSRPGETVLVQIEYQAPVKQPPNVLAAHPAGRRPALQSEADRADRRSPPRTDAGWGHTTDPVPDRNRIEPPVLDPREHAPINPVQITVRLQAGFPLAEVKSHHHTIKTDTVAADTHVITLADGKVPADRDFELTWKSAAAKAPSVGLFRERVGNDDYLSPS